MQHIKVTKRDGTCEAGWERRGDVCVKKGAPADEVAKEIQEFHKSLRAPKKGPVMEVNKRTGAPLIKG